jgi:hypothetical protein
MAETGDVVYHCGWDGSVGSMNLFKRNSFFDQHNRNVIADGVEDLPICADQTGI